MTSLIIYVPFAPTVQLGPLTIHWYGLMYAIAFIVGAWVAIPYAVRRGVPSHEAEAIAFWSIVLGLISARLYYDFQSGAFYYLTHPIYIFDFLQGGMAYYGAVFVVPIFIYIYSRIKKINYWIMGDAAALFAAVGQPIGRIGNIINGDILGYRSNLPWATAYTNPATYAPKVGVPYQPAGAYELLIGLCILGILAYINRKWKRPGRLLISYLFMYAISQFGIFFLRNNSITALGLKQAQLSSIALLVFLIPFTYFWYRVSQPKADTQQNPEKEQTEPLSSE
jgi:phosphatidylglycerol:prolipoprotein diacylglycerol transferase